MKTKKSILSHLIVLVVAGTIILCQYASAALILNIDTTTEEFYLSGNATGTPADFMGSGSIGWFVGITSGGTNQIDASTTLGIVGDTINNGPSLGMYDAGFFFSMSTFGTSAVTLTGNDTRISYAGAPATRKTYFESTIDSNLALSDGTGFGDISVQGSAATIPEPSTLALLMFSIASFACAKRGKRQS